MRKLVETVPFGLSCFLQPGNRLIRSTEIDQINPNFVVRIAKLRIDRDGLLAFRQRLLDLPQFAQ